MAKNRYRFNPQTLTYEVIAIPFRIRFYRILRKILVGFILASVINILFSYFFFTPKMYQITRQNNELIFKYEILQEKIRGASEKLQELQQRDQRVYRPLFGADTLDIPGIYTPYADSKYAYLQHDNYSQLMTATWKDLDAMTRLLYRGSRSLDELEILSKDKEKMADAIPAIWPIDRRYLRGNHIGAFGTRRHPVYGHMHFHSGIDLGSDTGTPIYATGDGRIVFDTYASGYGKQVIVEHGFGYRTRYAHLSKILVAPGQEVKRGELIGEVGRTGTATGPHLHYGVIYMGRHVDPLNYFSRDMSEEEFERIIASVKPTTYE